MLNSDFLLINFDGFRHKSQQVLPKVIFVRGANSHDTTGLQPQVKFSLIAEENKKTYAWLAFNLHSIVWKAGNYDHTFIFIFLNAFKFRFPNSTDFTKDTKKCTFLRNFLFKVVELYTLGCPKQFNKSFFESSKVLSPNLNLSVTTTLEVTRTLMPE